MARERVVGIAAGFGALIALCLVGCTALGLTLEGDRHRRQGEMDAAISAYQQSLSARSSQRTLRKLKEAEHLKAVGLVEAALRAQARSNHEAAFHLLSEALDLNPEAMDALDALEASREALHREAAKGLEMGRHDQALVLYELILSQYRRDNVAKEGLEAARHRLADDATAKAHQIAKTSHGAAFLGFVKALTFEPDHGKAKAGLKAMTLALEAELREAIGEEGLEDVRSGQAQDRQRCCQETLDTLLQEIEELEAAGWTNPALDRRLLLFIWTGQDHYIADSVTSMGISGNEVRLHLQGSLPE